MTPSEFFAAGPSQVGIRIMSPWALIWLQSKGFGSKRVTKSVTSSGTLPSAPHDVNAGPRVIVMAGCDGKDCTETFSLAPLDDLCRLDVGRTCLRPVSVSRAVTKPPLGVVDLQPTSVPPSRRGPQGQPPHRHGQDIGKTGHADIDITARSSLT